MANLVLAFAEVLAGAVVLDAAIKGDSITNVVQGKATQHALVSGSNTAGAGGGGATTSTGGGGVAGSGITNPIPGFTIGRDDMGVDANAKVGSPIVAPAASRLISVHNDWYNGQSLLLFQFVNKPAGAPSDYWYVAEQISPVTTKIGTLFREGETVARYAASGTGIEIGWGDPNTNQLTLAGATDPGAANPPAGSTTTFAESFKKFFGIP
jgi:hypothetical protein